MLGIKPKALFLLSSHFFNLGTSPGLHIRFYLVFLSEIFLISVFPWTISNTPCFMSSMLFFNAVIAVIIFASKISKFENVTIGLNS